MPRILRPMRVFLDFEASSLGKDSYPIEVGWAGEDGWTEAHLIRPAPGWTDWDATAEAVHKITLEQLLAEGEPHDAVARRVLEALAPHEVFVSAPSWDGKWMSVLLRAAKLPRHALRLRDSEEAFRNAVNESLRGRRPDAELRDLKLALIAEARRHATANGVSHRALADARQELETWREVGRLARAAAGPIPD